MRRRVSRVGKVISLEQRYLTWSLDDGKEEAIMVLGWSASSRRHSK